MQTAVSMNLEDVITHAIACARTYAPSVPDEEQPSKILDMTTTGGIPAGYSHLIFVAFGRTGYMVSRNLEGHFKVEISDQMTA